MSLFPRIQSPCPYKGNLSDIMDGAVCRMCKREVHDIGALSEAARMALIAECSDEICVSYTMAARTVLAAAALGAGFGMSGAVAAQTVTEAVAEPVASAVPAEEEMWIIVGGLKAPQQAVWIDSRKPANVVRLPVIYEDQPKGIRRQGAKPERKPAKLPPPPLSGS